MKYKIQESKMRIAEKYELLNTIATTVVINKSPDDLEEYLRECANHGIDKSDPKACGKLLNVITEPGLIDIWRRADDFKPVKPIKPEGKLEVEDAVKIAAAVLTPTFSKRGNTVTKRLIVFICTI